MNKIAHYLQEHLTGEVMTGDDALNYFAIDASVLNVRPAIIVYPHSENDIRKTARFTWQLAERGRVIPMTARGSGTDQSGAAIGSGIIMAFPAHMNRILELDTKSGTVTIEPGINYGKLQQTLHTHNRFLPPYPASMEFSTVGGAIANNAAGIKSVKYGSTRDFVKSLRVVLANGEVIETGRISKRELNKKLGLASFEGEVYRSLDGLIEENQQTIRLIEKQVTKNAAGYALNLVKNKNGSFDLTPLFVGSQGTLGIVSEAVIVTESHNPKDTLIAAYFDDLQVAEEVILELRKFKELPSAMELVDDKLLNYIQKRSSNLLKGVIEPPFPKIVLLIEFDNGSDRIQKRLAKKTEKILAKYQVPCQIETDDHRKDLLWKIRETAALIVSQAESGAKALPIIEDGIVPVERFKEFLNGAYDIFERHGLQAAVWGHAGDANLHLQPLLNLSQVGDRQKVFKLLEEYYNFVINLGGSTSAQNGDGRIRAAYLQKLYGPEVYELFQKTKKIFDPYNTLNPGVKINITIENVKPLLRHEYNIDRLLDHLPKS